MHFASGECTLWHSTLSTAISSLAPGSYEVGVCHGLSGNVGADWNANDYMRLRAVVAQK